MSGLTLFPSHGRILSCRRHLEAKSVRLSEVAWQKLQLVVDCFAVAVDAATQNRREVNHNGPPRGMTP